MCEVMVNESLGTPLQRLAVMAPALLGPTCLNVSHANTLDSLTNISLLGGVNRIWCVLVGPRQIVGRAARAGSLMRDRGPTGRTRRAQNLVFTKHATRVCKWAVCAPSALPLT